MVDRAAEVGARLRGIKALITDSELSRAIAVAFAHEGADVAHYDRDASAAGPQDARIEQIARKLGGLDVLVINTAFEWQHDVPDEHDLTTLERAFRTGLEAAFQLAQSFAPHMNDGGSIILTAPMRHAHPAEPVRAFVATSHAVSNLTASLAQTLASRHIRVNTIVPGPVRTQRTLARLTPDAAAHFGEETLRGEAAEPEDLAPSYVFLAAAGESGFVNGATLEVTGGAAAPLAAALK